ncbi:MAG TPA: hypothetical protein VFJ74_01845 [Gemmatimonadaceae bacterium]|nr:hypothetical protein [Gemmatimonadaceae bacterium]
MANDRDRQDQQQGSGAASKGAASGTGGNREHTFGKGMTSPDSTEAVLDASTGEPDPRARGDQGQVSKSSRDQDLEQDV